MGQFKPRDRGRILRFSVDKIDNGSWTMDRGTFVKEIVIPVEFILV